MKSNGKWIKNSLKFSFLSFQSSQCQSRGQSPSLYRSDFTAVIQTNKCKERLCTLLLIKTNFAHESCPIQNDSLCHMLLGLQNYTSRRNSWIKKKKKKKVMIDLPKFINGQTSFTSFASTAAKYNYIEVLKWIKNPVDKVGFVPSDNHPTQN